MRLAQAVMKAIHGYLRTLHSRPVKKGLEDWSFRPKFNPLIDRLCLHRLWTPGSGIWFADLYRRDCAEDFVKPISRSPSSGLSSEEDEEYDSDEVGGTSDIIARRHLLRLPNAI